MNELHEDAKDTDVTDVAGGTRHHRKIMLDSLTQNEQAEKPMDSSRNTRSTRSSRLRGPTRATVNYNEEKVSFNILQSMIAENKQAR